MTHYVNRWINYWASKYVYDDWDLLTTIAVALLPILTVCGGTMILAWYVLD